MTLGELQAMRAALIRARMSGVRVVRFADRSVEYRSDAEMAAQIEFLDEQIAVLDAASAAPSYLSAGYGRTG